MSLFERKNPVILTIGINLKKFIWGEAVVGSVVILKMMKFV